ncbi:hypothetical protein GCM10007890_32690 [Methylobacterium tardum]|uniref:Uncharacterized protein n=2 Tax=Methylobacterium tardum TaxID=374432 RepID=A0AA37TCM5_9HYPH|nr:hypothetical protein GCM10007890_32690 [Methylobacterium tardum]
MATKGSGLPRALSLSWASCDPAGMSKPLYPVEDGPGAGRYVDVVVRVMVGPRRSTVLVERQGEPASLYETREHGRETDGLGDAVEAAVREGLARLPQSSRVE